jgi:hypothetical protein
MLSIPNLFSALGDSGYCLVISRIWYDSSFHNIRDGIQLGLMRLCTGLMFMARNPGGHEPQLDYPLDKEDALDLLTLISFQYREIDKTSYIGTQ